MKIRNPAPIDFITLTLCVSITMLPASLQAQPTGNEFQVNTTTANHQLRPDVAADDDGNFIVVFENTLPVTVANVSAQRFDSGGQAIGSEFLVNSTLNTDHTFPAVAMAPDGRFVVAWQDFGDDGSGTGIFAQRYNSDGLAQGANISPVNTTTQDQQHRTDVAMHPDGSFVVVWEDNPAGNVVRRRIRGQRFNASGVTLGGEFDISTEVAIDHTYPKVVTDRMGNFIVGWSADNVGANQDVLFRRYDTNGIAQGLPVQVNVTSKMTHASGTRNNMSIDSDSEGNLVIAWRADNFSGPGIPGATIGILARRYDASGNALGAAFKIDTNNPSGTFGASSAPEVAVEPGGRFAIAYEAPDGSLAGIVVRLYSAGGQPIGTARQHNTTTTLLQENPAIALDGNGRGLVAWEAGNNQDGDRDGVFARLLVFEKLIVFANPASNQTQQSFLRVVNTSSETGLVTISGIDGNGNVAPGGDLTFTLGPGESKNMNSLDYENGNVAKGLTGALGNGAGKWHLTVTSPLNLEVMSLIRTPDGFVTSVTNVVPLSNASVNEIYFANPASNQNQQSFLRVVNNSSATDLVTISAIDKTGTTAPGGELTFTLGPNESKNFNSQDYENGNPAKDLTGALGDGTGKWWMSVNSMLDLNVMSLIRSPGGFVTNLSSVVPRDAQNIHHIYFANPASNTNQQSFFRIINTTDAVGSVTISGIDDDGNPAPGGDVVVELGAFEVLGVDIQALEAGTVGSGSLGDGNGRWQLSVSSTLSLQVMSLIRTSDGFVTNLSKTSPMTTQSLSEVYFFNPASNPNQRSFLRIINTSAQAGSVTITGIDDAGNAAPGGIVTLNINAFSVLEITATQLENGDVPAGLSGALGDGSGKWRLSISSLDVTIGVMNLLQTPTGFLTNLSSVIP